MRFSTSNLLATAYFTLCATALPKSRPAATYRVVDVGGPSSSLDSPPAVTLPSTSTSALKPETVTVTASPSEASVTATQSTTVTVADTTIPATFHTVTMSPLPVIVPEPIPSTTTETTIASTTETVYSSVPAPAYVTAVPSSSSSSSYSSSSSTYTLAFKGAFTTYGHWNHTISTTTYPSVGTAAFARFPTSVPCPDEQNRMKSY